MIISNSRQFIFIKTRKTAGSTLEKLLFPYLDKHHDKCTGSARDETPALNMPWNANGHVGYDFLNVEYPVALRNYFVFTIERNPWDKVVSSYHWHQKIKPQEYGHMHFEDYIRTCTNVLPNDWPMYYKAQPTVFFYEKMEEMYDTLNEKLGLDISKESIYNTKLKSGIRTTGHYTEIHTPYTIERVGKLFANEIKAYGYNYGN